jgi:hypothetical protein
VRPGNLPRRPVSVYRFILNLESIRSGRSMTSPRKEAEINSGGARSRIRPAALFLASLLLFASPALAQDDAGATPPLPETLIEVDLMLVLGTDVSGSVSHTEAFLQRKGYADAFRHREVITAIESGGLGRIAVAYIDWSSRFYNQVLVDWTMIDGEEASLEYANMLMRIPRTRGQGTSVSDFLEFAMAVIEISPYTASKTVIDVSGDGPNRSGRPLLEVRQEVIDRGIVINGLPVVDPYGWDEFSNLAEYFEGCVIGGPGAFVQVAEGFADFSRAIRRKLVLELSGLSPENLLEERPEGLPVWPTTPEPIPSGAPQFLPTQSVPLPNAADIQPFKREYEGPCDTWDFYR